MLQKIKIMLFSLGALLTLSVPALVPSVASAGDTPEIRGNLCQGATLDPTTVNDKTKCEDINAGTFKDTLGTIINIISILVGVIAVIMIIVGGFKYITSGGEAEKVKGAKNTILYGLIGLVIVALAQIIVKFVLNQATKSVG